MNNICTYYSIRAKKHKLPQSHRKLPAAFLKEKDLLFISKTPEKVPAMPRIGKNPRWESLSVKPRHPGLYPHPLLVVAADTVLYPLLCFLKRPSIFLFEGLQSPCRLPPGCFRDACSSFACPFRQSPHRSLPLPRRILLVLSAAFPAPRIFWVHGGHLQSGHCT